MRALVIIALLAGAARADDQNEAHNKLGFRIGFGRLDVEDRETHTFSLGLNLEHPVWSPLRVFGEYELLWLGDEQSSHPSTEGFAGSGHRVHIGLRTELMGKTFFVDKIRLYLDGELGGGLGVASNDVMGVQVLPHAFVGARAGYTFLFGKDRPRSSRTFEAELLARAFRMPGGDSAVLFGIGMAWGD